MAPDFRQLLLTHLADPGCAFSIGGFGAIAEFQDDDVELDACEGRLIGANSARGAIRIELGGRESALAYETRAEREDAWQYGLGIIGEAVAFGMSGRTLLTELHDDADAIRAGDREAILFDLGAGLPHIDFCVRSDDRELIKILRRYAGQSVIAKGHPVMDAIIDVSPHRVVCSRIARIEVYQRIDRHQTPNGPHTHLLPDLLERRRTHSANIPIPAAAVPLLTVHPENPLLDALGRRRPFVEPAYARFEKLLERYGDPLYVGEKQRLRAAIKRGEAPDDYVPANSRVGRLAQRIVLRQVAHTAIDADYLERWRTRFGY